MPPWVSDASDHFDPLSPRGIPIYPLLDTPSSNARSASILQGKLGSEVFLVFRTNPKPLLCFVDRFGSFGNTQINAWKSQEHALEIMKEILYEIVGGTLDRGMVTSTVKIERQNSLLEM